MEQTETFLLDLKAYKEALASHARRLDALPLHDGVTPITKGRVSGLHLAASLLPDFLTKVPDA